jgi:hypothetical protein
MYFITITCPSNLGSGETEEKKHLFLTFNSLVQGADKLRQKHAS